MNCVVWAWKYGLTFTEKGNRLEKALTDLGKIILLTVIFKLKSSLEPIWISRSSQKLPNEFHNSRIWMPPQRGIWESHWWVLYEAPLKRIECYPRNTIQWMQFNEAISWTVNETERVSIRMANHMDFILWTNEIRMIRCLSPLPYIGACVNSPKEQQLWKPEREVIKS